MATEISATEAVRKFSELLNSVKYHHDSFTIVRGGKPLAAIIPLDAQAGGKSLKELGNIIRLLPGLATDAEAFAADLKEIVTAQPSAPESSAWG